MTHTTLRVRAGHEVQRAIREGRLVRLSEARVVCVDCRERRAVHYEHRDYQAPLAVDPVCQGCNLRRGRGLHRDETYQPVSRQAETCPACRAEWLPRVPNPIRCPRCGNKIRRAKP